MGRWSVALLCFAGCDQTWGLLHIEPPPLDAKVDDGSVDGPVDGPIDARVDGPADALPACPEDYTLTIANSTSRYWYRTLDSTWSSAETLCETDEVDISQHTHLVVVNNDAERTGLFSALKSMGLTKNIWIGLTDLRNEGTFRWVTNQGANVPPNGQSPWASGQPDNNLGDADCVRLVAPNDPSGLAEGRYDDVECIAAAGFAFVCECDGFVAVPANYTP